jgi:hypothetical protein
METYILKPGRAISTAKGIIGPPVDPQKPTEKELVTEKNFKKDGASIINALLARKNCPIELFEKVETKSADELKKSETDKNEKSEESKETPDKKPDEKSAPSIGAKRK